jgi:hypothetical protein
MVLLVNHERKSPMRRYIYKTETDVSAEKLYRAITDINRWIEWDDGVESTALDGPCVTGAKFTLKPNGGPMVRMIVEEALAPTRFVDVTILPLARMRIVHNYVQGPATTEVTLIVEVTGILAFLWDRAIARSIIADADKQTGKMIAYARHL